MISKTAYRKLKSSDGDFRFSPDGITLVSRAALEISNRCPDTYRYMLAQCVQHGWIQPVAYIPDAELTWEKLQS